MKIYALVAVCLADGNAVVYADRVYDTYVELASFFAGEVQTCSWWRDPKHHEVFSWHIITIDTEEVDDG